MLSKYRSEALRDAACDILDLMFFVAAEEASASPPGSEAMILAQVEFQGLWAGRCTVEMPEALARTMAGNFTGILEPGEVHADLMIETICELANMICGGTITRMGCPGIVTLSPPHLIEKWPRPKREVQASERWLDSGEGIVHLRFEAEAAA
jgi:CheY-specific phosphatase CheX